METASWHSSRVQNLINLKKMIYKIYSHCSSKWTGIAVSGLVILGCTIAHTVTPKQSYKINKIIKTFFVFLFMAKIYQKVPLARTQNVAKVD